MRLLKRSTCRPIRDIRACKFERPLAVVAAAGVEFGGVIREGEHVSLKKTIETSPRGIELRLSFFKPVLRDQHIGKTPIGPRDRGSKAPAGAAPPRRRVWSWLA